MNTASAFELLRPADPERVMIPAEHSPVKIYLMSGCIMHGMDFSAMMIVDEESKAFYFYPKA